MTGADAIHPGYGFLSENAHFAEVCASCGFTFIGPTPEMIRKMGDKAVARRTMTRRRPAAGAGQRGHARRRRRGAVAGARDRLSRSSSRPRPAAAGAACASRGTRSSCAPGFGIAQAEAGAAFGNDAVYLEKYIARPRHIEFQLFGDTHGNLIHLGERECSVQRNHQKLIEESPSPFLSAASSASRSARWRCAGAQSIGYLNAGTMEFLFDQDGSFYFMEMNTRIQVEHPVTEEVTGLDLVKEQIRVAAGEPLSLHAGARSSGAGTRSSAASTPRTTSTASGRAPGTITYWYKPGGPGIRVDSHVYAGYTVPPYYDSMIGKLIAYGKDRARGAAAHGDRARRDDRRGHQDHDPVPPPGAPRSALPERRPRHALRRGAAQAQGAGPRLIGRPPRPKGGWYAGPRPAWAPGSSPTNSAVDPALRGV